MANMSASMIAAEQNKGHTLLLLQFTNDLSSKTFLDYDDIGKCVDGVCQLYEQYLKIKNPGQQEDVTYDASELFAYIDSLKDVGCLIYNFNLKAYEPKSRDWLKQQVYNGLKNQAA